MKLQSTLPIQGVTLANYAIMTIIEILQSTLPIQGVTIDLIKSYYTLSTSIHTPNTGSDYFVNPFFISNNILQSTLPIQGVTHRLPSNNKILPLLQSTLPIQGVTIGFASRGGGISTSIHTPNTGSDRR